MIRLFVDSYKMKKWNPIEIQRKKIITYLSISQYQLSEYFNIHSSHLYEYNFYIRLLILIFSMSFFMLNNPHTPFLFTTILISLVIHQGNFQTSAYNWTKPDNLNIGLPKTVQIYTLHESNSPFGTKLTGGFARFDMNDSNLQFIVKDASTNGLGYALKTPIEYAQQQENVVYAAINGGYFNMQKNISVSLIAENSKVKTPNTLNSDENTHPTVGAIGLTIENRFEIQYVYSFGNDHETFKYALPNRYPGPPPYQDQGIKWEIKQGLGGGPILIKQMQVIQGNVENFDVDYLMNMRHSRSAVCIDVVGRLYFVAIDGYYDKSDGMKMLELADLMQNLNCYEAMNLDGGGSTLLYANNKIINRPSDETGPRPVASVLIIRDRYKKKVREQVN